jgi:nucleoside-diphosphate-sugar epimerase
MKVFVFGGSGYIGQHLVRHLIAARHSVTGFARSDISAAFLETLGATPWIGNLDDMPPVLAAISDADAVIWAAQLMLEEEHRVVTAMLEAMEGTDKAFILTSGTSLMSIPTGGEWDERSFAEDEPFEPRRQIAPRLEVEALVRSAGARGIRAMVIRPPLIWGHGGSKIIADFYHSARVTGAVCFVGRGLNVYSNVHVDDLANLDGLALEKGVAGALYFGVAGEVSYGVIAGAIARHLGVPTRSVTIEEGCDIWDRFMARIVMCSCSRQRSPRAREELGWVPDPERLDILEDCNHPAYALAQDRPLPSWVRPGTD